MLNYNIKIRRFVNVVLLALIAFFSASVVLASQPVTLEGIRVSGTKERVRLVLDLSEKPEFTIFSLSDPARLVLDLHRVEMSETVPDRGESQSLVSGFVAGKISATDVRVVLTLAGPALAQNAFLLSAVGSQPARLVFELEAVSAAAFLKQIEDDKAKLASPDELPAQSVIETEPEPKPEPEPEPEPEPAVPNLLPVAPPVALPSAPAPARQIILIDPGHGGIDGGAVTPTGLREKDFVFLIASQLEDKLIATGKFDVGLTRSEDVFVGLKKRVDLARQNKVDLFISLHADSFTEASVGGVSIYTLAENATDILDKVLVERENKADLVAGFDLPENKDVVVDILVDLMRRETRQVSFRIASSIVDKFEGQVKLRKLPLRQADFFVLQAPEVPSILIELGFLSNVEDVQNLSSLVWRVRVVDAIVAGIVEYLTSS